MFQNYLRDPFSHAFNDTLFIEILQIPTSSPYEIQLKKMPILKDVNTTRILKLDNISSAFTEVFDTSSPLLDQCVIDYLPQISTDTTEGTGKCLFNSGNAGEWVVIEYSQVGNINLKENVENDTEGAIYYAPNEYNRNGIQVHRVYIIDRVFYAFYFDVVTNNYKLAYKPAGVSGINSITDITGSTISSITLTANPYVYINRAGNLVLITDTSKHTSIDAINITNLNGYAGTALTETGCVAGSAHVQIGDWIYTFSTTNIKRFNIEDNTFEDLAIITGGSATPQIAFQKDGVIYYIQDGNLYLFNIIDSTIETVATIPAPGGSFINGGAIFVKNENKVLMPISAQANAYLLDLDDPENSYKIQNNVQKYSKVSITENTIYETGFLAGTFASGYDYYEMQTYRDGSGGLLCLGLNYHNYKCFTKYKNKLITMIHSNYRGAYVADLMTIVYDNEL